jgi:hypothetical protein
VRGNCRSVAGTSLPRTWTRRCSFRFCHRHYVRARSRLSPPSLDPVAAPGRGHHESNPPVELSPHSDNHASGSDAPVRRHLRRRDPREHRFPFRLRTNQSSEMRCSENSATSLVITLRPDLARRRETRCNHIQSVTEGLSELHALREEDVYLQPETPSIEYIELGLRARLAGRGGPLKRGSRRPGMPF